MANDVKWIKLMVDIFDNAKFDAIKTLPDGRNIQLAWFNLLCLAGKCNENGFLMLSSEIPYTDEMMAKRFDMTVGEVQRALQVFQKLEMIEVVDDIYMVSNWSKYQNIKGLEEIHASGRERTRRYRERQKLLKGGEDFGICQYCGGKATGYDHIIPTSKGGKDIDSNKIPCCIDCNRIKNDKPLADFLNANRERIKDEMITKNPKLKSFVRLNEDGCYVTVTSQCDVTCSISISNSNSSSNTSNLEIVKEIVGYLNEKTGKNFKYKTESTIKNINGRLADGYTVDDFKKVIDTKCADWKDDDRMNEYLRPGTLFTPAHFESYLNQKPKQSGLEEFING